MMVIDVLSSGVICGVGALVGAVVMRPALAQDDPGVEAMRLSRWAFALIGVGLGHLLLVDGPLPLWSQAAMAAFTVAALILVAWALAELSQHAVARGWMRVALVLDAAGVLSLLPLGTRGMTIFMAWGLFASSGLVLRLGRRLVLHPRDAHERLIGVLSLVMFCACAVRLVYLFVWDGPYPSHLMYMPPAMITPLALLHAVLPVVYAMALFNLVNARLQARLLQRAMTDHLTGVLSRQALDEGAALMRQRLLRREVGALAVVMIDLDRFKAVNDRHGHAGGDAVLRESARLLRIQLRADSLLARYGGEEFVALMPVDDVAAARRVAERMRQAIESSPWTELLPGLTRLTASFGLTLLAHDEGLEAAVRRADEALYRAKNGGRNQVQIAVSAA